MLVVRPALPADGPAVLALIQALAAFEKLPGPTPEAGARLMRDAFLPHPRIEILVAELDEKIVGYALYFQTYSTFRGLPTLFLEDLFVHPDARRKKVASELLTELTAIAVRRGCGRFEWMVLDWNEDAQKLYDARGAKMLTDWRLYRLDLPDPE